MDREIPKEEIRKAAMKKRLIISGCVAAIALGIYLLFFIFDGGVKRSELSIHKAELGPLESTVSAVGKIEPLYQQAIVSPVSTRIMEVYCNEGDQVEAGQSLLRLDLQATEADYQRMVDEVSMKKNEIEQAALNNTTRITDLEMKIKAKEMSVSHLRAEVANERRLDSIGSGTGDRIREAELAYSTGLLELQQMKMQLENEKKISDAAFRSKQLEESITLRNLQTAQRMLEDARVKAPRTGTVTYINGNLGTSIAAGEKLAVVSDLNHFKIHGEIPESNSGKLSVGSTVNVRINRNIIKGHISTISPQSINGQVEFTVLLDDDTDKLLRSGLRTELNVVYDLRDDVVRIPNGQYFLGAGTYSLYVKTDDNTLERRTVELGDSNFNYVEVKRGIRPGEEVVISDLSNIGKDIIKLKD